MIGFLKTLFLPRVPYFPIPDFIFNLHPLPKAEPQFQVQNEDGREI